jgi:hypothetical protein
MKKTTTKFMAVFLLCTCLLGIGTTQRANATINNTYGWSFGIIGVWDGKKMIDSGMTTKGEYTLTGSSVSVLSAYAADTYVDRYVSVDNNYVGNPDDSSINFYRSDKGNFHYSGFTIKNLTAGKHIIEVRADRPWNLGHNGPMQKIDSITVIVPQATTSAAITVK